MSIRAPRLRGLSEGIRTPLFAPLMSAILAFAAWHAASLVGGHTLLVAARQIPAGQSIGVADVVTIPWHGPLPNGAISHSGGFARVGISPDAPILQSDLSRSPTAGLRQDTVGLPLASLFSAPNLTPGERVAVYYLSPNGRPQIVVSVATVAQSGSQTISLRIPLAELKALLVAAVGGHLCIVLLS